MDCEVFEHAACTIRRKALQGKVLYPKQNAPNSPMVMRGHAGEEEIGEY